MSQDDSTIQFVLTDRWGVKHTYSCTRHPGGLGMGLVFDMLELGIGPVVEGFRAAFSGGMQDGVKDSEAAAAILAKLDTGAIARQINQSLATGKAPKVMRALFVSTQRDGMSLSNETVWDMAWQGNYAEAFMAARKIVEHNGFLELLTSLHGSANELADATRT